MSTYPIRHLPLLATLCLAAVAHTTHAAVPAPVALTVQEGAVTRTLSLQEWRIDKRGVPSFDYHYRQRGPGCDYQRDGRAVAGFEDLGSKVELEVFNPEGEDGKEGVPIMVFYGAGDGVVFSMPVPGKGTVAGRKIWVSYEDGAMKKTLPKKCGHSGRGDPVMFKK